MRSKGFKTMIRLLGVVLTIVITVACANNPLPIEPEPPSPPPPPPAAERVTRAPSPSEPPPPSAAPAIEEEAPFDSRTLQQLNQESPLQPVFFDYNSSRLSPENRRILQANAGILKQYPTWTITVEGHCDERGSPEYNLALGERRALVAQEYLVELGLRFDRIRTVSYGKEFPFAPGHDDESWARNRRAHFVITEQ